MRRRTILTAREAGVILSQLCWLAHIFLLLQAYIAYPSAAAALHEPTTRNLLQQPLKDQCPDGSIARNFICNCTVASRDRAMQVLQVQPEAENIECEPLCRDSFTNTCHEQHHCSDHEQITCVLHSCGTRIELSMFDRILTSNCTYIEVLGLHACGTDFTIDETTYRTVVNGACTPSCWVAPPMCMFEAKIGPSPGNYGLAYQDQNMLMNKTKDQNAAVIGSCTEEKCSVSLDEAQSHTEENCTHLLCTYNSCSLEIPVLLHDKIKSMNCEQIKDPEFYACGSDFMIDSQSYKHTREGECESYCGQDRGYKHCNFTLQFSDSKIEAGTDAIKNTPEELDSVEESETILSLGNTIQNVSSKTSQPRSKAVRLPDKTVYRTTQLYISPWVQCRQWCDTLAQEIEERYIVCQTKSGGIPVTMDNCDPEKLATLKSYRPCQRRSCVSSYELRLGQWSDCSSNCSSFEELDGDVVEVRGSMMRIKACMDRRNHPVNLQACEGMWKEPQHMESRTCNSLPCQIYRFEVGEWDPCNCNMKSSSRRVQCTQESSTNKYISPSFCTKFGLEKPTAERRCTCRPQRTGFMGMSSKNSCLGMQCSGEGRCQAGECICPSDFEGPDCQFDNRNSSYCTGALGPDGNCCGSGYFDIDGKCCKRIQLDRHGKCCDNILDPCGACGGRGLYSDALGRCCERTLDAMGLCCESGLVDECGVCDGYGASCGVSVSLHLKSDEIQEKCISAFLRDALRLRKAPATFSSFKQNGRRVSLIFSGSLLSNVTSTKAIFMKLAENAEQAGTCKNVWKVIAVSRTPICGNSICEVGEAQGLLTEPFGQINLCPTDCPLSLNKCAETGSNKVCFGHGICHYGGEARCHCFRGYEGNSCNHCAPGFFKSHGDCLPRQKLLMPATLRTSGTNVPQGTILLSTLSTLFLLVVSILVLATVYCKTNTEAEAAIFKDKHTPTELPDDQAQNHV